MWRNPARPRNGYLRLRNVFSKTNFDTGFETSSVDILDISPYTKSEHPRIAGKHLTRHAKNGDAAVAKLATRLPKFLVGTATAAAFARSRCMKQNEFMKQIILNLMPLLSIDQ